MVDDPALAEAVSALRADGEVVVTELPGHAGTWNAAGCDRQLVSGGDGWTVAPLSEER